MTKSYFNFWPLTRYERGACDLSPCGECHVSHVFCTILMKLGFLRYAQRGMPRVKSPMGGTKVPKIFLRLLDPTLRLAWTPYFSDGGPRRPQPRCGLVIMLISTIAAEFMPKLLLLQTPKSSSTLQSAVLFVS